MRIPESTRPLVEAGAASALGRGLLAFTRRACARIAEHPENWAPQGGILIGLSDVPPGLDPRGELELQEIRDEAERLSRELSALSPHKLSACARGISESTPSPAGDVGSLFLTAAAAAAIWAAARG